jgi:hypothetical protein
LKKLLGIVAVVLFGAVLVASIMTRPPSSVSDNRLLAGAKVPPRVLAVIERSCRDCHSYATRYPLYSYVFPISRLIGDDVKRGREHLNFSQWSQYPVVRQERALSEIANQVQDGGMPLTIYTWMHRDAKLSEADVDAIFAWTQEERMRLIQGAQAESSK